MTNETDEMRLRDIENNLGRMEVSVESLANSVKTLTETMGDYNVIADRTLRNAESLIEVREALARESAASVANHARNYDRTENALNSFRKEMEEIDTKIDKRGDARLKWGLGLAITINFASISVIATVIMTLFTSTQEDASSIHDDVTEIKEIVIANKQNISHAEQSLQEMKISIKENYDNSK